MVKKNGIAVLKSSLTNQTFIIEPSKASKEHLRRAMPLRCLLDVLDGEKMLYWFLFSPPKKPKALKIHLSSYFLLALTLILKASCGFFTSIKSISFSENPRSRKTGKR